jgi:protein-S-isoprenylcysteine O-methyltransferase Ste14
MTPRETAEVVVVALATLTALSGALTRRAPRGHAGLATALLAVALWLSWVDGGGSPDSSVHRLVVVLAGILAVAGGGLVTLQVFSLVDQHPGSEVRRAGEVLRGGAWIGSLERLAVYAAVVVGWGPGLAIVLAVKGLGRYPELRNQEDTGAAERFIIGTFTSVLWAVACAGLAALTG